MAVVIVKNFEGTCPCGVMLEVHLTRNEKGDFTNGDNSLICSSCSTVFKVVITNPSGDFGVKNMKCTVSRTVTLNKPLIQG
ncbi:MAG: hypothetical protein KAT32_01800 [Candidatus Moranbacteria bacterium]|nr:hypothetical protein [Candidatus Moranbacteria bacterium]